VLNWVEIDAGALRNNVAEFKRRLAEGPRLGAVVKSNAYGHGMIEVARVAADAGADWLCVNNVDEGIALRERAHAPDPRHGFVPLDALGSGRPREPVVYNLRPSIGWTRSPGRARGVHVKIETGTHRQASWSATFRRSSRASRAPLSRSRGHDHFANIEDSTNTTSPIADPAFPHRRRDRRVHPVPFLATAPVRGGALFNRTHLDLAGRHLALRVVASKNYVSCLERGKPSLDLNP
jgi:alanine racemase